jgi:hypothetical protein
MPSPASRFAPVELPPALVPMGPGTVHRVGQCECGLGPHWGELRGSSFSKVVEVSSLSIHLTDESLGPFGWEYTVDLVGEALPGGKSFTVVELTRFNSEAPDWWRPPPPPRPAEAVNTLRWADEGTIEYVQWHLHEPVGATRTEWRRQVERVYRDSMARWWAVYWRHGQVSAVGCKTMTEAVDYLADGDACDDLAPIGVIRRGAESGEFV